ncbi:hypothetical protein GCM10027038_12700 [Arthrobacter bambusae]
MRNYSEQAIRREQSNRRNHRHNSVTDTRTTPTQADQDADCTAALVVRTCTARAADEAPLRRRYP